MEVKPSGPYHLELVHDGGSSTRIERRVWTGGHENVDKKGCPYETWLAIASFLLHEQSRAFTEFWDESPNDDTLSIFWSRAKADAYRTVAAAFPQGREAAPSDPDEGDPSRFQLPPHTDPYTDDLPPYTFSEAHGDLLSREQFLEAVHDQMIMDSDGHGHPVRNNRMDPSRYVYPSAVELIPEDATHIIWFNK